ncbi:iron-sulfur cluster-binding protein [Desulfuromusa kysingii]|uniref:Iron-sulfur cluster-binding protein n=1 Tax=Desulfuromusa kysingii TaxID=37625 RepID=A0A1H3XHU7_9BACT|nr:LUD domain-containing protein [Desulfuromusa kysingii]SDZ98919.1 iron-sulfur cluster-binding protein [Desulfuromusa kysingii]
MSKQRSKDYRERIDTALATPKLQDALHQFGDAFLLAREKAFTGHDFEALRGNIATLKSKVRQNHAQLLQQFIANAEAAGSIIYQAKTAADANRYIIELAKQKNATLAVKSKSMVSEETHLSVALEQAGTQALETDLGEWIVQLAGQRPSHMVMPAIHMFKEEVAELFSKETGEQEPAEIEHLVEVARNQLRQSYLDAEIGITGANIAIAETGGIALVTNEGNARLVSTLPKVHVVLVGIEKLVATLEDAAAIIQILPKNATGQLLTSYVTWIRGAVPCDGEEKELHIVLLDNGRSSLTESPQCRDALNCIRCGACANVCPVYQTVGGHVFGHVYIGAIGIILTAFYHGLDNAAELVKACIGCRSCVAVCPSQIDLEEIILHLRETVGDEEGIGAGKSLVFRKVMQNRKLFHSLIKAASLLQKPVTKGEKTIRHLPLFFSPLTEWRTLPAIADKALRDSFNQKPQHVDKPRYRVALFGGCANDFLYPELGLDLIEVMNALDVEVFYPQQQNCCGIPAIYSGDKQTAVELAKQNIEAMLEDHPDYVLTTCPTCAMALKHNFVEALKDNPAWAERAERLSHITVDAASFALNQLDGAAKFAGLATDEKITYHDSCHLKRGVGVWEEPRTLIKDAGYQLVEMNHADRCCGFGGSYSLTSHPDISKKILQDKVADIQASGATCVAMDCPGCMMQIRGGLEKAGVPVRAQHTIELLAEALKKRLDFKK